MLAFKTRSFQHFFRIALALLITICLIRVYEYFAVASKFFIANAYRFELAGLMYDVWLWLIYICLFILPYLLLSLISNRLATVILHCINAVIIISYLGLLLTFSERNTPFDHELFTRNFNESIETTKQMVSSSWKIYLPFIIYLFVYFLLYFKILRKVAAPKPLLIRLAVLSILSVVFIKYSNPSPDWFKQTSGYYLTSNKLTYFAADSYEYFATLKQNHKLNNKELEQEIDFYQQNHPFNYTSKEYPLLHENNGDDVLGSFFNFKSTPPNIVILVVEGLSRDFSGKNAYAGSFTPFLDSLSEHSLTWDNVLSTAPGTFAAHPSITGSLPYGKRGFSIMNVMPDHLSLVKILKANGYFTSFMIGFNPDFDNMGGYIRLQGTDFILTSYPSKYKEMGVGKEGWSMGYPDDALFPRSLQALDSINKTPYLSMYHTATTHMPYLFEQKPLYEKLFDQKIRTMNVKPEIKRTLKQTKEVLTTFMFSDDCLRNFFAAYAKRREYGNTIFFITGDHHIGSFPSTGAIDDYHVPFIVYSPMLKRPQRFLSVNSHLNIAPTISTLLSKNFKLNYQPKEVHWLGDVIDTCTTFRNKQSMAFMWWGREINDYIYKEYFLSDEQLYKLTPDLLMVQYKNDTLKGKMTRLRENFKIINNYVCDSNKIYPSKQNLLPGDKELLKEFTDPAAKLIFSKLSDTSLTADFKVPLQYKYLYVEATAKVNMPGAQTDYHPTIRFALIDPKNNGRKYLYWSKRDIATLSKGDFIPKQWNNISVNDMFPLDDYKNVKDLIFETAIYTDSVPINLKMQNLDVRIYGIKNSR
jgi:phosphoglycerol transferase MdoB-like AlkP superfamily enzyme